MVFNICITHKIKNVLINDMIYSIYCFDYLEIILIHSLRNLFSWTGQLS